MGGFGTTINLLYGETECNMADDGDDSSLMNRRIEIFTYFNELFGANFNSLTSCSFSLSFSSEGSGNIAAYWYPSEREEFVCEIVLSSTQYSIYDRDDYKRCICDNFGDYEQDCQFEYEFIPEEPCLWTDLHLRYDFFDAYIGQGTAVFEAWTEFENFD